MAPEVFKGDMITYSADIWSLGCVMAELMNRSSLFPNLSYCEMVAYMMRWKEKDIVLPSFYSKELRSIIHDMLVLNWKGRPSAEELLSRPYFHGESFEGKEWTKRYGERSVIHVELQSVIPKEYAKKHEGTETTKLGIDAKYLTENSNALLKIVRQLSKDFYVCSNLTNSNKHDISSKLKKGIMIKQL